MKFNGLLIAVVVLACLGGGVYWSEHRKAPPEKPAADAAPKILTIPEDQIKEISVAKKGSEPTVITKLGGKWEIVQPKPMPADQDSVGSMVSSISNLSADRLIEEKAANLASFGLTSPSEEIDITKKDGKVQKLYLGDESPVGSGVFAKLENDPRVFTVASYVKTNLDKSSNDLRDKRLLTFNSDKLTRVALKAKGQDVEFGKNNQNDWQILKPKPYRADGFQVDELIRKLKDAKMDVSLSADDVKKAQAAFNSGTKVGEASVTDASGNQTIEVRKDKDKTYYAKSSIVEGIYKIPADLGEALGKGVDDFRNKKLFDFGFTDPTKLDVRNGDKQTTYQKSGDKWMAGSAAMDSSSVQSLIDKMRDLTATKLAEKVEGTPAMELTVTTDKRTEKVAIAKKGETYLATRDTEPGAYELDSKAVGDLQKAASDIKPGQAPKNAKK